MSDEQHRSDVPIYDQAVAATGFTPEPPSDIAAPPAVAQLAELLAEHRPEIMDTGEGDWAVSVPCGHLAAVEADYAIHVGTGERQWFVYTRAWAPDHGLNSEQEVGEAAFAEGAAEIVATELARIAADDANLDAQMAEAFEADERS